MEIKEFGIDNLKGKAFNMSICGKSDSGKSVFLYNILYNIAPEYKFIYFITSNAAHLCDRAELRNFIWKGNSALVKNNKEMEIINESFMVWLEKERSRTNENFKTLLIYDDVSSLLKSDSLYAISTFSRHHNLSLIILLHDPVSLHNQARVQMTYKVTTSQRPDVRRLYDIKDNNVAKILDKGIEDIGAEKGIKKYVIVDAELNLYYYIVAPEFVTSLKKGEINILAYNQSQYKDELVLALRDSLNDIMEKIDID